MHPPALIRRRAAVLACVGLAAARTASARGTVPLRDFYDADGTAPSALARALEPCQLCGGAHDWPTGVVAVHAHGLPHLADPYARVTLEGVLVLDPAARAPTGLPDRLVLREAGLASA